MILTYKPNDGYSYSFYTFKPLEISSTTVNNYVCRIDIKNDNSDTAIVINSLTVPLALGDGELTGATSGTGGTVKSVASTGIYARCYSPSGYDTTTEVTNSVGPYTTGTTFIKPTSNVTFSFNTKVFIKAGDTISFYIGLNTANDNKTCLVSNCNTDDTVRLCGSSSSTAIYYISYNKNAEDAEGTMPRTTVSYGQTTPLVQNVFTRSGYRFTCWHAFRTSDQKWLYTYDGEPLWCTKGEEPAEAVLRQYNNNTSVSKSTEVYGDTIILYAQWEAALIVNYYSNYATSYNGALTLGSDVIIDADHNSLLAFGTYYCDETYSDGLYNYTKSGSTLGMIRDGYTSKSSWNTKTDGSGIGVSADLSFSSGQELAEVFGKDITSTTASIDLYAQWEPNTYKVIYSSNGYNFEALAMQTKTHGIDLVLHRDPPGLTGFLDPSKYPTRSISISYENTYNSMSRSIVFDTGEYVFNHWNTATDGSGKSYNPGDTYSENSDVTLYVICTEEFNNTVTIKLAEAPERTGYSFLGWYDSIEGGNKVGDPGTEISVSDDLTVYAHWEAQTFTITYDYNEAVASFNGDVVQEYLYEFTVYVSSQIPIYPGYAFRGWRSSYSNKDYKPGELYESPGCDETLQAIYEEITGEIDTGAYIKDVEDQDTGLDWGVSFNRKSSAPLDRSSLFSSKEDAEKYAKGTNEDERGIGSTSYVGQILSVYEKTADYETVSVYVILPDKTLAELFTSDKYYTIDGETAATADPESFTSID